MSYQIEYLDSISAVKISIEGQLNMGLRKKVLVEAVAELKRSGLRNLIIDVTNTAFSPGETHLDAHALIAFMRRLGFPYGTRIAMIHPEPDDRREFFADLSALESFDLDYLPNQEEAENWFQQR